MAHTYQSTTQIQSKHFIVKITPNFIKICLPKIFCIMFTFQKRETPTNERTKQVKAQIHWRESLFVCTSTLSALTNITKPTILLNTKMQNAFCKLNIRVLIIVYENVSVCSTSYLAHVLTYTTSMFFAVVVPCFLYYILSLLFHGAYVSIQQLMCI